MKRAFDFMAALGGLILLSPFLLLAALLIKIGDFGPVFYGQVRVGRGGRPFRMWKFRSMRPLSDKTGPSITIGADARITPVGRVLRKTKMDELPQLWNVVRGEMSLVGPRPEVERYTSMYSTAQKAVLELVPGVTDPASFAFFDESEMLGKSSDPEGFYIRTLMPEKIRINLEYAAKRGFLTDLAVIMFTVLKPLGLHLDLFKILRIRAPEVHIS